MATLKEWVRDFKRKPKWDQFSIIFTIVIGIIGLFLGGNWMINNIIMGDVTIDNPEFNINNSSKFGINYKSPNSPITITETIIISDNLDPNVYPHGAEVQFTDYFEEIVADGYVFKNSGLKYDLFNVKIIFPTNQEIFMSEVLADQKYIVAYLNRDYSDAYILHEYRILPNFYEEDVCLIATVNSNWTITLSGGPKYFTDRKSCYKKVSGKDDILEKIIFNPPKE